MDHDHSSHSQGIEGRTYSRLRSRVRVGVTVVARVRRVKWRGAGASDSGGVQREWAW